MLKILYVCLLTYIFKLREIFPFRILSELKRINSEIERFTAKLIIQFNWFENERSVINDPNKRKSSIQLERYKHFRKRRKYFLIEKLISLHSFSISISLFSSFSLSLSRSPSQSFALSLLPSLIPKWPNKMRQTHRFDLLVETAIHTHTHTPKLETERRDMLRHYLEYRQSSPNY